jgi:hypothetical protein
VTCAAASLSTTTILAAPRAIPALLAIPTTLLPRIRVMSRVHPGCTGPRAPLRPSVTLALAPGEPRVRPGASGALLHPRRGCRVLGLPGPYRARDIALTFGLFPFTRHPSPRLRVGAGGALTLFLSFVNCILFSTSLLIGIPDLATLTTKPGQPPGPGNQPTRDSLAPTPVPPPEASVPLPPSLPEVTRPLALNITIDLPVPSRLT